MMKVYEAKTFSFPQLGGMSQKTMDEHVGLYQGYVKNFNSMSGAIIDLAKDPEKNSLAIAELRRRRSFEFGGMRLHEYYFEHLRAEQSHYLPTAPLRSRSRKTLARRVLKK